MESKILEKNGYYYYLGVKYPNYDSAQYAQEQHRLELRSKRYIASPFLPLTKEEKEHRDNRNRAEQRAAFYELWTIAYNRYNSVLIATIEVILLFISLLLVLLPFLISEDIQTEGFLILTLLLLLMAIKNMIRPIGPRIDYYLIKIPLIILGWLLGISTILAIFGYLVFQLVVK